MRCDAWKAGMHCASVRCEMKVSLMVCCFCPPCPPPLCNSPIERRNQSKIHYTLRVSPVPSSTRLASTASPLDRRITTGPRKLIPALFWINLSQSTYSYPSLSRPHPPLCCACSAGAHAYIHAWAQRSRQ